MMNLFVTEEAFERIEHNTLATGRDFGNIGIGRPSDTGFKPADLTKYEEAVSWPDAERSKASIGDEEQSLHGHDVFDSEPWFGTRVSRG